MRSDDLECSVDMIMRTKDALDYQSDGTVTCKRHPSSF